MQPHAADFCIFLPPLLSSASPLGYSIFTTLIKQKSTLISKKTRARSKSYDQISLPYLQLIINVMSGTHHLLLAWLMISSFQWRGSLQIFMLPLLKRVYNLICLHNKKAWSKGEETRALVHKGPEMTMQPCPSDSIKHTGPPHTKYLWKGAPCRDQFSKWIGKRGSLCQLSSPRANMVLTQRPPLLTYSGQDLQRTDWLNRLSTKLFSVKFILQTL